MHLTELSSDFNTTRLFWETYQFILEIYQVKKFKVITRRDNDKDVVTIRVTLGIFLNAKVLYL